MKLEPFLGREITNPASDTRVLTKTLYLVTHRKYDALCIILNYSYLNFRIYERPQLHKNQILDDEIQNIII